MRFRGPIRLRMVIVVVALIGLVGVEIPAFGQSKAVAVSASSRSAPGDADESPLPCSDTPPAGDGRLYARCFGITHVTPGARAALGSPPPTALAPSDIRSAYQLPQGGDSQTVAIVDAYGYDNAEADLAVYREHYGLPACTAANGCFRKVDQRGGSDYPVQDVGWAGETALDLDAVSAACPQCHLLLVQGDDASFDALGTAVDTAVRLGATVVSNSYGSQGGEDAVELDYDHFYDHPGVAIVVSSGDIGNATSWPSTSPSVTSVGGTRLERDTTTGRGWAETAWGSAGSGCSPYEQKPIFQQKVDTSCDNRASADISAVADPDTGLAVYDSYGYDGWLQIGGTSLSAPLVAGMYALAGTPEPGTYPVTYPYAAESGFHDVTEGANGSCGDLLCNAVPGWDGPTGLGTPAGVGALQHGRFGHVTGTVTDTAGHRPIEGASVSTPEGYTAVTDERGRFDLAAPPGSYDVTVTDYDYYAQTRSHVTVQSNQITRIRFQLERQPTVSLSGTVSDGPGHGWPLYARIRVAGYPHGDVFTDPTTGRYHVSVPVNHRYELTAIPEYAGYQPATATVTVGSRHVTQNLTAGVDETACMAPGYGVAYHGTGATFDTTDTPEGWTVTDNTGNGHVWRFDNPGNRTDFTGGDGHFAIMDSWAHQEAGAEDTSLVSPVADLTAQDDPTVSFDSYFGYVTGDKAYVDLSLDGGATWQTVFEDTERTQYDHQVIPLPQAAGHSKARVRFRYTSPGRTYSWWQLDNIVVGDRYCGTNEGGLVVGQIQDRNTGRPVHPATIRIGDTTARTVATPEDPGLGDGFYWMFADSGRHSGRASATGYAAQPLQVDVRPDRTTRADTDLAAGRIVVRPGEVSATVRAGQSKRQSVTITNTGTAPAKITLAATGGRYQIPNGSPAPGANVPAVHIHGQFSPNSLGRRTPTPGTNSVPQRANQEPTGDGAWQHLATYPTKIMDNAVAESDGTIFSLGGVDGQRKTAKSYRYDPTKDTWSGITDLPEPREGATAAVLDGHLYVTGGESDTAFLRSTLLYDPDADSWTPVADAPKDTASHSAGSAVMDGRLYLVGGCMNICGLTAVRRYDPTSDTWDELASYPLGISHIACGGIEGKLYCAGGTGSGVGHSAGYVYNPATDAWSPIAALPEPLWGAAYTAAGGELVVAGGIGNDTITNATYAYDPATDSWSELPPSPTVAYRGGSTCGLVRVGGSMNKSFNPTTTVEELPGHWGCADDEVTWIDLDHRSLTLAPGQRVSVTASLRPSRSQSGTYHANVWVSERTPYAVSPVSITMRVAGR